uniref:uncharacterized protein LOC120347876 n=1 Tax=Styela clava TaxID=7725 RepID=UPI0019395525|nr:uncharacterized protein LOC120347876 [Styela clava]
MARTPKIDAILKRRTGKGAIIDQATRWGSTYLMIQRLLEIKNSLIDMANPDITLTDLQWRQTHQLEELLREPYLVTKRLQAQDLTPGSFYKEWKNLIYKLSQSSSIIADAIKASMLRRAKCLLDNPVLLAAIYVDPMYRVTLSEEQLNRGKAALCDIAVRMHRGSRATQFEDQSICASGPLRNSSDSGSECEIDFEKHLDIEAKRRRTEKESRNSNSDLSPLSKFKRDFFYALNDVEKIDRSYKLDILKAIPEYPEIVQNVAYMVTALPPTQVSVERLFSALRIIRSDLRASMKEDLVKAILFLRTNSF